jgi:hypothetical protein
MPDLLHRRSPFTHTNGTIPNLRNRENEIELKKIVQGPNAKFSFYRQGNMYYTVPVDGIDYVFPVSLEDIGSATLSAEFKAITLMRYIRKALADGTFVKA